MIHLKFKVKPQAKQRPRFNRRSGKVYTESETFRFERLVRLLAKEHISEPLRGSLRLVVLFVYAHLKKDGNIRPERKYKSTRPDLSNLIKSFEDGLQSVAFNDDAQIVSCTTEKIYGAVDEEPHIEFTLEELTSYQEDSSTSYTLNARGETPERETVGSLQPLSSYLDIENGTRGTNSARGETPERERETVSSPQLSFSYLDIENKENTTYHAHRETLERVRELESLDRVRTPEERQELKDKRRVLNQVQHRAKQDARHEAQAKERKAQKIEGAIRKLAVKENERDSIKEAEEVARKRESEAYFNRLTAGLIKRPWITPDNEDFDDDE